VMEGALLKCKLLQYGQEMVRGAAPGTDKERIQSRASFSVPCCWPGLSVFCNRLQVLLVSVTPQILACDAASRVFRVQLGDDSKGLATRHGNLSTPRSCHNPACPLCSRTTAMYSRSFISVGVRREILASCSRGLNAHIAKTDKLFCPRLLRSCRLGQTPVFHTP